MTAVIDAELYIHLQLKGQSLSANTVVTYCTKFMHLLNGSAYLVSRNDLLRNSGHFLLYLSIEKILKEKEIVMSLMAKFI